MHPIVTSISLALRRIIQEADQEVGKVLLQQMGLNWELALTLEVIFPN